MARAAAILLPAVLTACSLGGVVVAPVPVGPTLVLEVTNRSDRDVAVGYSFDSVGTSGSGESLSTACRREALMFGRISGQYLVTVEGDRVAAGAVAEVQPRPGTIVEHPKYRVIRLRIHPNGGVEVTPPVELEQAPETNVAIVDCGDG